MYDAGASSVQARPLHMRDSHSRRSHRHRHTHRVDEEHAWRRIRYKTSRRPIGAYDVRPRDSNKISPRPLDR